jgi:hypothetical protein
VIFWHYEAELMLGLGTSPDVMEDSACLTYETLAADAIQDQAKRDLALQQIREDCAIDRNPWPFSVVDYSLYQKSVSLAAAPVVVYYVRPIWSPIGVFESGSIKALWTYTKNYVTRIFPTNPDEPTFKFYSITEGELPFASKINPVSGYIEGRIIKATMESPIRKTYEVTIQEGALGNNFTSLSVNNSRLYDHIVMSMLSGRMVRVGYVKLFSWQGEVESLIRGYRTYYRMTSIEVLPKSAAEANTAPQ